jgi:hypothetical protein
MRCFYNNKYRPIANCENCNHKVVCCNSKKNKDSSVGGFNGQNEVQAVNGGGSSGFDH